LRIAAKTAKIEDKEPKKSRRIGFFNDEKEDTETATATAETEKNATDVTAAVTHEKPQPMVKNCLWCNNTFEYVVYNKKYCCEDCKIQAWEARTKVKFDLELKKKERLKNS
jgi:hypothetical protein